MHKNGEMTFEKLIDECPPNTVCEVYSVPNPGQDDRLTWRVRVPGRGVYMGLVDKYTDEHGEAFLAMAEPAAFIPEN
jgi:hypothetical protein